MTRKPLVSVTQHPPFPAPRPHPTPAETHPILPLLVPNAPSLRYFWGDWFALLWCPHLQCFGCSCLCSLNPVTQCCMLSTMQKSVDTPHLMFFSFILFMVYYFLFILSCHFRVVWVRGVYKLHDFNVH